MSRSFSAVARRTAWITTWSALVPRISTVPENVLSRSVPPGWKGIVRSTRSSMRWPRPERRGQPVSSTATNRAGQGVSWPPRRSRRRRRAKGCRPAVARSLVAARGLHAPLAERLARPLPGCARRSPTSTPSAKSDGSTTERRSLGSMAICAAMRPTAAIQPSTVAASAFHSAFQSGSLTAAVIEGTSWSRIACTVVRRTCSGSTPWPNVIRNSPTMSLDVLVGARCVSSSPSRPPLCESGGRGDSRHAQCSLIEQAAYLTAWAEAGRLRLSGASRSPTSSPSAGGQFGRRGPGSRAPSPRPTVSIGRPANGRSPVRHSNSTTPKLHKSAAPSRNSPPTRFRRHVGRRPRELAEVVAPSSGRRRPVQVPAVAGPSGRRASAARPPTKIWARPKSSSFGCRRWVNAMLLGLMSRCSSPRRGSRAMRAGQVVGQATTFGRRQPAPGAGDRPACRPRDTP